MKGFLSLILGIVLMLSVVSVSLADCSAPCTDWVPVSGDGFVPAHLVFTGK